jgi:two-component system OmpR family response regulator
VRLTALEYGMFHYLALHAGRPVSKTELTEHLYAQDFDRDSNTLEVIVARLRRKLGDGLIETIRGQGYRLHEPR